MPQFGALAEIWSEAAELVEPLREIVTLRGKVVGFDSYASCNTIATTDNRAKQGE